MTSEPINSNPVQDISRREAIGAVAAMSAGLSTPSLAADDREWTVMVYMNGKNNLESDALDNFHAMASVGSTDKVSIVAQLGRPKKHYTTGDGNWSGVYRFLVTKELPPLPDKGTNVETLGESTDMGKPECLSAFVRWSRAKYPAKRYMLIVWNHGQGFRFQLAKNLGLRAASAQRGSKLEPGQIPASNREAPLLGGFRAISSDDDTRSILYNRQVQDVVEAEFKQARLDLLGFDACLMNMFETAYAFDKSTQYMVGSEELEPGAGWDYQAWLTKLVADPAMSAELLGTAVVDAYAALYKNSYFTTLSLLKLGSIRSTGKQLSKLADLLRAGPAGDRKLFHDARLALGSYADWYNPPMRTSVDLCTLLKNFEASEASAGAKAAAATARQTTLSHVVRNYASTRSSGPYGSTGVAIYYPRSQKDFKEDPYSDGYIKTNTKYPVDFVREETWAELLYSQLNLKWKA